MRALKIVVSIACALCFATPAFAQAKNEGTLSDKEIDDAVHKAVNNIPVDSKGAYDTSKMKLNKKDYMEQISKSFDMMDKNGDGVVEGSEITNQQKINDADEDSADTTSLKQSLPPEEPVRKTAPIAPEGGVPPINEKELIKK
jgi:Ca2+-binding EF-hand superfamily protein